MRTISELHEQLTQAYERSTLALNQLAEQIEALPGKQDKPKPAPKQRKPKSKSEVNGVCEPLI